MREGRNGQRFLEAVKIREVNSMKRFLSISVALLVALVLTVSYAYAVEPAPYPSTNDLNRTNGRPHVNLIEAGVGYVTLEFVNDTNSLAYFEVVKDGQPLTEGTAHPNPRPWIMPGEVIQEGVSVDGRNISEPVIVVVTFNVSSTVAVRLALGGERDWDFDWVTYNALQPTITLDYSAIFEGWSNNNDGTYTLYFGYENRSTIGDQPYVVTIAEHELTNKLTPPFEDAALPETLEYPNIVEGRPGRTGFPPEHYAFTVRYNGEGNVVWTLGRKTATGNISNPQKEFIIEDDEDDPPPIYVYPIEPEEPQEQEQPLPDEVPVLPETGVDTTLFYLLGSSIIGIGALTLRKYRR